MKATLDEAIIFNLTAYIFLKTVRLNFGTGRWVKITAITLLILAVIINGNAFGLSLDGLKRTEEVRNGGRL